MTIKLLIATLLWALCTQGAWAQQVSYRLIGTDAATVDSEAIVTLAGHILEVRASDPSSVDVADRAHLLLAARDYAAASAAFDAIACTPSAAPTDLRNCFLGSYALARHKAVAMHEPFDDAFRAVVADRIGSLDDVAAERVFGWWRGRAARTATRLEEMLAEHVGADAIPLDDATRLVKAEALYEASRASSALMDELIAQERARRYRIDDGFLIHTSQDASLAAVLVRPMNASDPLPTTMWFTIYSDPERNLEIAATAAAHGYAGLVVNARGKLQSTDVIRPYEVEVDDTVAAIEWASRQPWSDGRVGMYGGSYTGFAAWAATKHLPDALRTIVPYVAAIPGQGLPMENNVFLSANYGWPFYVTNNRTLDRETYNDPERWSSLNNEWYQSGRPYRDIDQIDGTPNPWLQRWLQHPGYDEYWQAMVPYGDDFARIDIPVLTITGYYDDGQISAVRYLSEHYRHNPDAEHYLVIGPYDHFGAQQPWKEPELRGYTIDPVAQFDTTELTFAWFDHVFRGAQRPVILADRINYEVMGANIWRHAPSLEAMNNTDWTFYLTSDSENGRHHLARQRPARPSTIHQTVDFADRSTQSAGYYPYPIIDRQPDLSRGLVFVTDPLDRAVEISGSFSGVFRMRVNKRDFDFMTALYELREDDSTVALSHYIGRASYAEDISARDLLKPGRLVEIPFDRTRLVSRRIEAGSRLLLVVDVLKNSFHQINYGTGGDVSDESIADAVEPLEVKWQTDSSVRVPITIVQSEGATTGGRN